MSGGDGIEGMALGRPGDPGAATWFRLDKDVPNLHEALRTKIGLDDLSAKSLTEVETRPRCFPHEKGALLNLRGINTEPGIDPEDMVSVRLWIDGERVVSYQVHKMAAVDELVAEQRRGAAPSSTGDFLVSLTDRITDRIHEVIEELDDDLENLEDVQEEKSVPELRHAIADLRKKVVVMRRFIAPQRDALDVLIAERYPWKTKVHDRRLGDVVDRITRLVEQLDSIHTRAAIVQDFLSVRVAERLNRTMLLLSIVTGVFLPLSLITGMLGMNVAGIPGTQTPWAFWSVSLGIVFLGFLEFLLIWRLRIT
ncbi:MAG: zinc transporter ZntB [Rhodobacteraceae bacterium]|nr:zinc transporter ZntB [Paracoccaceae bacterium]